MPLENGRPSSSSMESIYGDRSHGKLYEQINKLVVIIKFCNQIILHNDYVISYVNSNLFTL